MYSLVTVGCRDNVLLVMVCLMVTNAPLCRESSIIAYISLSYEPSRDAAGQALGGPGQAFCWPRRV